MQQIKDLDVYELSGKQKLELLGFDSIDFWHDVTLLENYLNFDYTEQNLNNNVYPFLRELKTKYGFDFPISIFGVDIVRLDNKLTTVLLNNR